MNLSKILKSHYLKLKHWLSQSQVTISLQVGLMVDLEFGDKPITRLSHLIKKIKRWKKSWSNNMQYINLLLMRIKHDMRTWNMDKKSLKHWNKMKNPWHYWKCSNQSQHPISKHHCLSFTLIISKNLNNIWNTLLTENMKKRSVSESLMLWKDQQLLVTNSDNLSTRLPKISLSTDKFWNFCSEQ